MEKDGVIEKVEKGKELKMRLDEFMDKNKEIVQQPSMVALNCIGSEKALEDLGDLIFDLLR